MNHRNWIDLARKLVDQYDLDYTMAAIQEAVGEYALSWFGEGVIPTTTYPNPFPVTMNIGDLGGVVGPGIAFDPNGQLTRIDASSPSTKTFGITNADPTHPRWDLLVLRYAQTGDTLVPKPSDPISSVDLNLHDDFTLAVIPGIPSATPVYPAKGLNDVILDGLRVPANATLGTQVAVDDTVRDRGNAALFQSPVFVQETPTGVIDGSNAAFVTSQTPLNNGSVLVIVDDRALTLNDWTRTNKTITLVTPPAPGQDVQVFYIAQSVSSQNPLSGVQEAAAGTVDGTNDTFNLTGTPVNQAATMAIVDGQIIEVAHWDLLLGTTNKIKFHAGFIPQPGQDVYAFYFVNAASVGIAPMGGGGGGGSAYVPNGTPGAPVVVSAAGGIGVTTDPRQLDFVTSTGGPVPITANPQIANGTALGQELTLIGTSDTNYIELADGNGLSLNGPILLKNNVAILLVWNGSIWVELTRR